MRGVHELEEQHHYFNFQNMKNLKYTFCREYYPEYQLRVLLRQRHYCDATRQMLNNIASYNKMDKFNKRTCLLSNTYLTMNKLLTPNLCIYGPIKHCSHLRMNGIYAKSFCLQKMDNRTLFLTGCSCRQRRDS